MKRRFLTCIMLAAAVLFMTEGNILPQTAYADILTGEIPESQGFKEMSQCSIDEIAAQTYSGTEILPKITVRDGDRVLQENADYMVSYTNNTDVGTAELIVTGTGAYTGVLNGNFEIKPASASDCLVSLSEKKYVYNGKSHKPVITVKDSSGKVLKAGTDYEVSGAASRTSVGRYKIRINFKVNYAGTKTLYYTIVPKASSSASARLCYASGGYDDIKFSWSKVKGASGYNVYYKKASAKNYTFYKATTGISVVKKDLTDGTKYTFKVIPYYKSGDYKYYSASQYRTASATTLKKATVNAVVTKGSKVRVKWFNMGGESGYQISKSSKKDGTNIVATYETGTGTGKTLKAEKNKKYYYKVRAYKKVKVNGVTRTVYGPWSSAKRYKRTSSGSYSYKDIMDYDCGNMFVLVNKQHAVSKDYYPSGMVTVKKSVATYYGIKLKKSAYDAYLELLKDARSAGHDFYICSGYRDFDTQESLYNNSLKNNGKKYTEKMFAYPGTSEHHTGYAIDVTSKSMGWGLKQNFTDYPDGAWITKNCADYGFIIRYPKGKTDITGYSYEPWHLRYVGKTAAKKIMSEDITLEEYLGAA